MAWKRGRGGRERGGGVKPHKRDRCFPYRVAQWAITHQSGAVASTLNICGQALAETATVHVLLYSIGVAHIRSQLPCPCFNFCFLVNFF